jgi:hypothetical protein
MVGAVAAQYYKVGEADVDEPSGVMERGRGARRYAASRHDDVSLENVVERSLGGTQYQGMSTAREPDPDVCDVCGSTDVWWRNCKLLCRRCGSIVKSCADL